MKNLILIVALSICIVACTSTSEKNENKNIELVKAYVNSVENLDFEAMSNYLDDNYMGVGPSIGDSINKVQAIENWKTNVDNLYASIKYNRSRNISTTVTEGENQGNWVSNWAEVTISYKDGSGPVTIMANTTYRIENGKITKSYTFYNEADALRQLGYSFILE